MEVNDNETEATIAMRFVFESGFYFQEYLACGHREGSRVVFRYRAGTLASVQRCMGLDLRNVSAVPDGPPRKHLCIHQDGFPSGSEFE